MSGGLDKRWSRRNFLKAAGGGLVAAGSVETAPAADLRSNEAGPALSEKKEKPHDLAEIFAEHFEKIFAQIDASAPIDKLPREVEKAIGSYLDAFALTRNVAPRERYPALDARALGKAFDAFSARPSPDRRGLYLLDARRGVEEEKAANAAHPSRARQKTPQVPTERLRNA